MRIDGIHIKNFLSFDTLTWPNLDPQLNIIVGPNGSGKTNLIYALRATKDVLNPNPEHRRSLWSQSVYRGSSQVPIEIGLDVQFTEAWEKKLLSTFLIATLCNDSVIRDVINKLTSDKTPVSSDMTTAQTQLSELLQEQLLPEDLKWLFTGRLVILYRGVNTWTYWYESHSNAPSFRLNLDSFSFYDDSVISRYLQILLSKQDQFTPNNQLLLSGLSSITSRIPLHVEYSQTLLATHRAFEQLIGVTLKSGRYYSASFVFHLLLERGLVFSDNIRSQPQYEYSYDHLHDQPVDLSNGEQLTRYLFLKKNGSQTERDQYEAIQKLFCKITGRSFDVGFDQPAISALSSTEKAMVVLSIHVSSDWGGIPLAFSGAGRAEALFVCTLIASRNEQVVLLDEPALNMHVTMQKVLLNEVKATSGNQYIIVTHSPALVPPEAIIKVSRFFMNKGHTCRVALDRSKLSDEAFSSLEKELRRSTDACAMLFSRGVILVEGETEQGALPVWFEKQFGNSLESDDIIIYSVNSDTNFGNFVRFLHQFNIPWAIICDGKVIGDRIKAGKKPRIVVQLDKADIPDLPDHNSKDFSQLCQEIEAYGVFTHANDVNDEIESLKVIEDHQEKARAQVGDSKARQGQYIATNYDCPDEIARLLEKAKDHLKKQVY